MRTIQAIFGDRVRTLRKAQRLTQEKLAEKAFLHRTYLASLEAGNRNVAIVNVVYLARALGVTPGDLFVDFTETTLRKLPRNESNVSRRRNEK